MSLRIEVDRSLCIGAATCVLEAPEFFDLGPGSQAIVIGNSRGDRIVATRAARGCPVGAITLVDDRDRSVEPQGSPT